MNNDVLFTKRMARAPHYKTTPYDVRQANARRKAEALKELRAIERQYR